MQLILIRHDEPDPVQAEELGFVGHGRDFAPLSLEGIRQAEEAARSPLLTGCELILTSPYTRALQTAAIISRRTGLPLAVEAALHEWLPDKTFRIRTREDVQRLRQDFLACKGHYPSGETRDWEEIDSIVRRMDPVLRHYHGQGWSRIALVIHGGLIRRLTGEAEVAYCQPREVTFSPGYAYTGWVDAQ